MMGIITEKSQRIYLWGDKKRGLHVMEGAQGESGNYDLSRGISKSAEAEKCLAASEQ